MNQRVYTRSDGFVSKIGILNELKDKYPNGLILARQFSYHHKTTKTTKKSYSYRVFTTRKKLIQFINDNSQNTNLFETILSNTPKIYFDIDKCYLTRVQIMKLEGELREFIRVNLGIITPNVYDGVLCWCRTEDNHTNASENDRYTSIHFTYPYARTTKENMITIVKRWNERVLPNNINKITIDEVVYKPNQQMNMPYQTKVDYKKRRCLKLLNLYSFDENCIIPPSRYLLDSHFDDCDIYKIINTKDKENPSVKIVQDWISVGMNKIMKQFNIETNPSLHLNENDSKTTHSVNKHSIIKTLITLFETEKLNKILFVDEVIVGSKSWVKLTQQLILYDVDGIDDWLVYSAECSNGKYSLSDNYKFKDKKLKDGDKFKGSIQKFLDTINEYNGLNICYKITDNLNIDKINWLSENVGLSVEDVSTKIKYTICGDNDKSKKSTNPKYINFNNEKFSWDYTRLLLYDNVNKTCKLFNETKYGDLYGVDFNNGWKVMAVKDLKSNSVNWFGDDTSSVMGVNAKWGTGKTHYCLDALIKCIRKTKLKVLLITENNALNLEYVEKFNGVSHLSEDFDDSNDVSICSLESLDRVVDWEIDVIVLDEWESLLYHFESDTMENASSGYDKMYVLFDKIRECKKVIALDADLTDKRLDVLTELKPNTNINKIYITENQWNEYTHNIYHDDREIFLNDFMNDLEMGKKLVLPTTSMKFGKVVYDIVINKLPKVVICMINSEGVKISQDGVETIHLKDVVMNDLTEFLDSNNIDVFIHSPSIKTGVSINKTLFHKVYGFLNGQSCCVREFIQMIYRCRTTTDKTINILCEYKFGEYYNVNDSNTIKLMMKEKIEFKIQSKSKFNTLVSFRPSPEYYFNSEKAVGIRTNPLYLVVRSINLEETEKSRISVIHELVGKIQYNHNIKINHMYNNIGNVLKDKCDEYKECAEDIKTRELVEFINLRIINEREYNTLKNKRKRNDSKNPITPLEQKLLTKYHSMRVFGVGCYTYDTNVDGEVDNNYNNYTKTYNNYYIKDKQNPENIIKVYDCGSITENVVFDSNIPLQDQMSKDVFDSINWANTKLYPYKNGENDNKVFYIKKTKYDYRRIINESWSRILEISQKNNLLESTNQDVVKTLMNSYLNETRNNYKKFISILYSNTTYEIEDIINGNLDGKITDDFNNRFCSESMSAKSEIDNQLEVLKCFWVMLKLDFYGKVMITNRQFIDIMIENQEFIKTCVSIGVLKVYNKETYLSKFNPLESSNIKKIKLLIKKVLKLIGYGYDYSKYKKYNENGRRIHDKNSSRPSSIMYFCKDGEFGFSGSLNLTNKNNDDTILPKEVYNVEVSKTNKKGRGVYYNGEKMYKLNKVKKYMVDGDKKEKEDRYINYKPNDVIIKSKSINDTEVSRSVIRFVINKIISELDLGKIYGFNMKYYTEDLWKDQQSLHTSYNAKYNSITHKNKCLIDIDDDDIYSYDNLCSGLDDGLSESDEEDTLV